MPITRLRSRQCADPPAASCRRHIHPRARRRHQIPIAPVAPPVPNFPRLRALALFGRRPPQRVEGFLMPASKNLHISRLMHRSKANPIRSLRPRGASTDAGRSRPSALAVFRLTTSSSAPADQPASLRPLSAQSWAMQERPQRQRPLRPKLGRSCRAVLAGASASVKSDAKCPRCLALHFWI